MGGSIGVSRLVPQLIELGYLKTGPKTPTRVLVTRLQEEFLSQYLQLVATLRNAGIQTEIFLEPAKLGKQIQYADRKGIPYIIVAGDLELQEGVVQIKNLSTTEKTDVKIDEILKYFKK